MRIKMKALASGPAGVFLEGHIYSSPDDLSNEQAQAWVDGGYAEDLSAVRVPVELIEEADETLETADAPVEPIEEAVKPRARKKS